MEELIVLRHGETEWNLENRFQGHHDSPLTGRGFQQATEIGKWLAHGQIDAIYSSDLGRAIQTAEIIGSCCCCKPHIDAQFREQCLGVLEGLTRNEARARFQNSLDVYLSPCSMQCPDRGESWRHMYSRTVRALYTVAAKHEDRRVVIVCHAGNMEAIFRYVVGLPFGVERRFSLANGVMARIQRCGHAWKLLEWGIDISFGVKASSEVDALDA